MFFLKFNYKYIILLLLLFFILAYVTNITSIPKSFILFEEQNLNLKTIAGVEIEETIPAGASISEIGEKLNVQKEKKYNLSLFGINLKTITASVIPTTKVIPLGKLVGLKLYTKGVLVVGTNEIKGEDEKIYKPYKDSGIEQGDSIIEVNDEIVNTSEDLISCVSKCKGKEIKLKYIKNGRTLETNIMPIKTARNTYKLGLWVRDAAAGVGTITFYEKNTDSFAALGHAIQDADTEEIVEISSGEVVTADILGVKKGRENNPGKIEGTIEDSKDIGEVYSNTEYGIYGTIINKKKIDINYEKEIDVASRNEIKTGKASIICSLDEKNEPKEYEVEIEKVYINNNENNKSMLVKVTDKELIGKTGGIIQGMSGSPIIQNGKFVGALTHVLVSDPTKRIWRIWRYNAKTIKRHRIKEARLLKSCF